MNIVVPLTPAKERVIIIIILDKDWVVEGARVVVKG